MKRRSAEQGKSQVRKIVRSDNPAIAAIVRQVMHEFNADPLTTVLADPALDAMYESYSVKGAAYFIASVDGEIAGGSGIRRLDGSDATICELQRMFLLPHARGKGIGRKLMQECLTFARREGYKQIYLESLSQMKDAIRLYEKSGFSGLENPLGNTGHTGCSVWMIMDLY